VRGITTILVQSVILRSSENPKRTFFGKLVRKNFLEQLKMFFGKKTVFIFIQLYGFPRKQFDKELLLEDR